MRRRNVLSSLSSIERAGIQHRLGAALRTKHDQQVVDHGSLALFVQIDHATPAELIQCISTMPTAPFTILLRAAMIAPACWHDHRLGNFLGIVEVADSGLDHFHNGLAQTGLDLVSQMRFDHVAMAAQRRLAVVIGVVRVGLCHLTQRRLALDVHIALIVIHTEHRFGRIQHLPHDLDTDFDRIAIVLVDVQLTVFEISHSPRNALFGVKRMGPAQAFDAHCTGVLAKQLLHLTLVGGRISNRYHHP